MSEIENVVPITPITVPSLDDVNYASSLNSVFDNINNNFITLANYDFIKGESGTSVKILRQRFFDDENNPLIYGQQLMDSIEALKRSDDEFADVVEEDGTVHTIWDRFFEEPKPGEEDSRCLYMIYSTENDTDINSVPKAVSSLYYVFLDGRYTNDGIGHIDSSAYENIRDFSCILVYDGYMNDGLGGFKALTNAFPTIYYENGVGLCWKINGSGTGLPVQGIPGKDGLSAALYVVKGDSINTSEDVTKVSTCNVTGIFETYYGYKDVEDYDDLSAYDGQSALVFVGDSADDKSSGEFYFGQLEVTINEEAIASMTAHLNTPTSINFGISLENVVNALKNINIQNIGDTISGGLKGLFIPIDVERLNEDNKIVQPVHLMSATSITNLVGLNSDKKTDLMFSPVNDINSIDTEKENGKLEVDKYLYLKIDSNSEIINATENDVETSAVSGKASSTNYYLKYKLEQVIANAFSEYLNVYNVVSDNDASRYYGKCHYEDSELNTKTEKLDSSNTTIVNVSTNKIVDLANDSTESTNNLYSSMPESFRSRLNYKDSSGVEVNSDAPGIYRWVLCNDYADYDIDELKVFNNTGAEEYSYTFDKRFKAVFTTSINPGTTTDIMWFNGVELHPNYKSGINTNTYGRYVIKGWTIYDDYDTPPFELVKFVPVYVNGYAIDEDTALNINYNVNITGDDKNPKKNITVHGDVNCDNVNVYSLTATKEIKSIYTPDDIRTEGGLQIGCGTTGTVSINGNDYAANGVIDSTGNLVMNIGQFNTKLSSPNIDAETLNSSTIDASKLTIDVNSGATYDSKFTVSHAIGNTNYIQANITNAEKVMIDAPNATNFSSIEVVPSIVTDLPSYYSNGANIVITNEAPSSSEVYFKNTLKTYKDESGTVYSPGDGVPGSTNITNTSFDSAKNFNIHRLSLQQSNSIMSSVSTACVGAKKGSVSEPSTSTRLLYSSFSAANSPAGCTSLVTSDDKTITADSPKVDFIRNNFIYKCVLNRSNQNESLYNGQNIAIKFTNDIYFHIGLYGKNENGKWPCLNSASYMKLHVFYEIDNGGMKYAGVSSSKYTIPFSTTSTANDNGYEWTGYDASGNKISSWGWAWRYYTFHIKPSSLSINYKSDAFNKIVTMFNADKDVNLYVVPEFYIQAHSQKKKAVVAGYCVTCPRSTSSTSSTSSIQKYSSGMSLAFNVNNQPGQVTYAIKTAGDNMTTVKSTTICDDGIVMRAGKYVFGLGYTTKAVNHTGASGYNINLTNSTWNPNSNNGVSGYYNDIPILFIHNSNTNISAGTSGIPATKYAQSMNAIPIQEIFDTIRTLRENKYFEFGV